MKRLGLILAGFLLAGCGTANEPAANQSGASSCAVCSAPPATAPAQVTPAVSAPVAPAAQPIFELTQDGKVYVFASVDGMTEFTNGKQQPKVVQSPNTTPGGKPIIFEAADDAQAALMLASYNKLHPVAK